MNFRKLVVGAATLAALLCVPAAQATPVTWVFDNKATFDDGLNAALTGSFTINDGTGALLAWHITTGAGDLDGTPYIGSTYDNTLPGQGGNGSPGGNIFEFCTVAAGGCGAGFLLQLNFDPNTLLFPSSGPFPINTVPLGISYEVNQLTLEDRSVDSGSVVKLNAAPEPSVVALLGLGLAGLGFGRRKRV